MKLICDFSFISNYVEKFFSDDRKSASIINSAISPFLDGKPILVISCDTIEELREIYSGRELLLDTVFDLCDKSDIDLDDRVDSLIKNAAIYEVTDEDTYVIAEDNFIINSINKTTHKAISINKAIELLKEKGLFFKRDKEDSTEETAEGSSSD